jgi:hypothetical protein
MSRTIASVLICLAALAGFGGSLVWQQVNERRVARDFSAEGIAKRRCEVVTDTQPDTLFRPAFTKSNLQYPYAVSTHDYDRDGRLDVVITDARAHSINLLLNRGGSFDERVLEYPEIGLIERHAFGDITGDSIPEMVFVDNRGGAIYWLDGEAPREIAPIGSFLRAYNVALADFDGNGLLDVAASNYMGNEIRVFFNPGSAVRDHWPSQTIASPGVDTRAMLIADFTGDGRPDIVTTARLSNLVVLFEYDGHEWRQYAIDHTTRLPTHAAVADIDGDGRPDVVLAAGFDNAVRLTDRTSNAHCTGGVFWYQNLADGRWQQHIIRMPLVQAFNVAIGDIAGNGRGDVAAVSYGPEGRLVWFENPGDPYGIWKMRVIDDEWAYGASVAIADLDGDGRQEIIATALRGRTEKGGRLRIWERW